MTRPSLLLSIALACLLFACDKPADISSPKTFNEFGLSFSYPGNWKITEKDSEEDFTFLSIEGGDALAIIHLYAKDAASSLDEFVQFFSEVTEEALPIGEIDDVSFSTIDKNIMSQTVAGTQELFNMKLLGQNIPHTREYFRVDSGDRTLFLITHIPNDRMQNAVPGFALIQSSLAIDAPAEADKKADP